MIAESFDNVRSAFPPIDSIVLGLAPLAQSVGPQSVAAWLLVGGLVALAIVLGSVARLRSFAFTAWIVAAIVAALATPQVFQPFAPDTTAYNTLLLLLVQAVMFGMGTQMGLRDFAGVARTPLPVAIGLLCQFTIMPLLGYGLALAFRLPGEIAAGMVLIGSCSSGLASNVMCYIGRANLALSITLTAVATLLAPIVTPFWMKLLASSLLEGTEVRLSFVSMMVGIVKIVLVPTGAALVHDYLLSASSRGKRIVYATGAIGVLLAGAVLSGWRGGSDDAAMWIELAAWVLGGVAFGIGYHHVVQRAPRVADTMPAIAMAGIIYVTGMTTADGRDNLFAVGAVLVAAAVLHNVLGFGLGYWMSRALGMDRTSARTVAFEVGMQNGGMATGLAASMGKLGTLGLPAAIFISSMNVTGSLLANYWRRRPINEQPPQEAPQS